MTEDELITDIAEAIGGVQRLADQLGVNRRLLMRWMNGHYQVPAGIWLDLEGLLQQRRDEVIRLFAAARTARLKAVKRPQPAAPRQPEEVADEDN